MDLFNSEGHLTGYAFDLIINEKANEMERLEISEHPSFCDECLLAYTERLSDDILIDIEESVSDSVISKIKMRIKRIFVNKYGTVEEAACFALIFWTTGTFSYFNNKVENFTKNAVVENADRFYYKNTNFIERISDSVRRIFVFDKIGDEY